MVPLWYHCTVKVRKKEIIRNHPSLEMVYYGTIMQNSIDASKIGSNLRILRSSTNKAHSIIMTPYGLMHGMTLYAGVYQNEQGPPEQHYLSYLQIREPFYKAFLLTRVCLGAPLRAYSSATMLRGLGRRASSLVRLCSVSSRPLSFENGSGLAGLTEFTQSSSPNSSLVWNFSAFRAFSSELTTPSSEPPTVLALKTPNPNIEYDECNHERHPPGDPNKQAFTYFVMTGGRFIYASLIRLAILKFILSMSASKDVLALASLEVDLSNIEPGSTVTVKWRGKPVFVRHRTEEDIQEANSVSLEDLRDPQPDSERVIDPRFLVVIGVCTHLGCVPLPNAGDYGGWFCPCHGSHYDISGRVRKGPAPYNLEVPTYKFMEEEKLLIG
ncbi:hypothetical protein GOP47_0018739 [Adiantum capillus-veneris]|uniref:quinol--cytochrome-c reductase n=1 Tax=Adiantum capillus-veneris TaxID=13818 RepID=A0A9D4Z9X4_ADICA|nr:hypothetical protein GOP47_0018739 [Adiantum capillus-veneris]